MNRFVKRKAFYDPLFQQIPDWIRKEIEENNSFIGLRKADSLPLVFDNKKSVSCECHLQLNQLRDELHQKNNTIGLLQSQLKELNQQNLRFRRREQQINNKFVLCQQFCTIQ